MVGIITAPASYLGPSETATELCRLSSLRFEKKAQLDTLWQTIAEEVNPFRATFTTTRMDGDEYTRDLYESTPCQNRRDLAYAMGALTRPDDRQWFDYKAQDAERNTEAAKAWFARQRDKQRTLLYNRDSNFQRAMHTGDSDFVSFGNAVHSHTEDPKRNRLVIYDSHHLRDCAWGEDKQRRVNEMHRKFRVALCNWAACFPGVKMPRQYEDIMKKNNRHEVEIRHLCFPAGHFECYQPKVRSNSRRFSSLYLDPVHNLILGEGGYTWFPYTVRRWLLDDDSPYAHSPAAMLGLIDARLLQSQARVILEAGERVVDPPMIARAEGVLGRVNNYPGYVNWVDANYDEKNGEALRALDTKANIPLGLEMKMDTRQILAAAWFINKLNLPPEKDMTAFEVNERISEYIRSIGPAVKPFETDNAAILDVSFAMNLSLKNFGPLEEVPPELRGADVTYEFDGPIQMAYKRQEFMKAKEAIGFLGEVLEATQDASLQAVANRKRIVRDGIEALGVKPEWLTSEEELAELSAQAAAKEAQMQQVQEADVMLAGAHSAAELVPKIAAANQAMPQISKGMGGGGPPSLYPSEEGLDTGGTAAAA